MSDIQGTYECMDIMCSEVGAYSDSGKVEGVVELKEGTVSAAHQCHTLVHVVIDLFSLGASVV